MREAPDHIYDVEARVRDLKATLIPHVYDGMHLSARNVMGLVSELDDVLADIAMMRHEISKRRWNSSASHDALADAVHEQLVKPDSTIVKFPKASKPIPSFAIQGREDA